MFDVSVAVVAYTCYSLGGSWEQFVYGIINVLLREIKAFVCRREGEAKTGLFIALLMFHRRFQSVFRKEYKKWAKFKNLRREWLSYLARRQFSNFGTYALYNKFFEHLEIVSKQRFVKNRFPKFSKLFFSKYL